MTTVLVVDDERALVAALRYNLEREGFRVVSAYDGEAALEAARRERPDLVILDLMLPVMDGFDVCRLLRRDTSAPVLMLTAKTDEVDKIVGLELGADDYMTKPFSVRELIARVRALLRRAQAPAGAGERETITSGDLRVDVRSRQAYAGNQPLALRPKEYELLIFLMRHRGRAFSREQLLRNVWGYDFVGDSRTVDVHVRWLREKIEPEPAKPTRIVTLRGLGYRFDS